MIEKIAKMYQVDLQASLIKFFSINEKRDIPVSKVEKVDLILSTEGDTTFS